jgi:3-phosphoshikimate 1-carboxyvinyltransferase
MALAVAGLGAAGKTSIDSAEAAAVTYPGFFDVLRSLGASVETTAEAER